MRKPVRDQIELLKVRYPFRQQHLSDRQRMRRVLRDISAIYPSCMLNPASYQLILQASQWCDQNLGSRNWACYGKEFYFTDHEQQLWFKLTWMDHYEENQEA